MSSLALLDSSYLITDNGRIYRRTNDPPGHFHVPAGPTVIGWGVEITGSLPNETFMSAGTFTFKLEESTS